MKILLNIDTSGNFHLPQVSGTGKGTTLQIFLPALFVEQRNGHRLRFVTEGKEFLTPILKVQLDDFIEYNLSTSFFNTNGEYFVTYQNEREVGEIAFCFTVYNLKEIPTIDLPYILPYANVTDLKIVKPIKDIGYYEEKTGPLVFVKDGKKTVVDSVILDIDAGEFEKEEE